MDRERIQPDEFRPVAGFELALSCFGNDPMLPAGNICGPGIRNYYLLQYCLAGRGVFYLDDRPYPVEAGQRRGTLRIRSGEAVVAELPLVAAAPVPRLTFWESAKRVLRAAVGASV